MIREVWRRYWPVDLLAVILVVVVVAFASYAEARQHLADVRQHRADVRAEKQRAAICAILSTIRGSVPREIRDGRATFARPGHPDECKPTGATPKPTPIPVVINGKPATIIVNPQSTRAPKPTPRPTPRPTATRTPRPSPSPTPTPTRTCIVIICR